MNDIKLIENVIIRNELKLERLRAEIAGDSAKGYCVTPLENKVHDIEFNTKSLRITLQLLRGGQEC